MIDETLDHYHFLRPEEEEPEQLTPVAEHRAFCRLPSDEAIEAVRVGIACFYPLNQAFIVDAANMWHKHLIACGYSEADARREHYEIIHTGLLAIMSRDNTIAQVRSSSDMAIILPTLAKMRVEGKSFQFPDVPTIRQRFTARRSS